MVEKSDTGLPFPIEAFGQGENEEQNATTRWRQRGAANHHCIGDQSRCCTASRH